MKVVRAGTVLMSFKLSIGKVSFAECDLYTNEAIAALPVLDPSRLDPQYLAYALEALNFDGSGKRAVMGTTLNKASLKQLKIPLPSLPEQRRIAGILDQADALRRLRRQSLSRLSDLGQAIFYEMFGDVIANDRQLPMGRLSEFVRGFDTGKNLAPDPENDNARHRVLKISAVTSGQFDSSEAKPLPDCYQPPETHFVKKGDLLFSRANTAALIGATAIVADNVDNLVLPDKLWRFRWHGGDEAIFTHHLFQSPAVRREISRRASGTSGSMKNIGKDKLLAIRLGIPCEDQREAFRKRIEQGQIAIEATRQAVLDADKLFASLQHRAFQGEL